MKCTNARRRAYAARLVSSAGPSPSRERDVGAEDAEECAERHERVDRCGRGVRRRAARGGVHERRVRVHDRRAEERAGDADDAHRQQRMASQQRKTTMQSAEVDQDGGRMLVYLDGKHPVMESPPRHSDDDSDDSLLEEEHNLQPSVKALRKAQRLLKKENNDPTASKV